MQAGITNAALASVGVQVMNVLMTVVAASLMDRAGRKQLLTISFRSIFHVYAIVHDNVSSLLHSSTQSLALNSHAALASQRSRSAEGQHSMAVTG